jgi:hypothetical protein
MRYLGYFVAVVMIMTISRLLGFSDTRILFGVIIGSCVYIINIMPKDNKQ